MAVKTLTEIQAIRDLHESELLGIKGVSGIDIGYKMTKGKRTDTLAIIVYVKHKADVDAAEMIPAEIEGVPVDVIERPYSLHT